MLSIFVIPVLKTYNYFPLCPRVHCVSKSCVSQETKYPVYHRKRNITSLFYSVFKELEIIRICYRHEVNNRTTVSFCLYKIHSVNFVYRIGEENVAASWHLRSIVMVSPMMTRKMWRWKGGAKNLKRYIALPLTISFLIDIALTLTMGICWPTFIVTPLQFIGWCDRVPYHVSR